MGEWENRKSLHVPPIQPAHRVQVRELRRKCNHDADDEVNEVDADTDVNNYDADADADEII